MTHLRASSLSLSLSLLQPHLHRRPSPSLLQEHNVIHRQRSLRLPRPRLRQKYPTSLLPPCPPPPNHTDSPDQLHSIREHSLILRLARPLTPTTDKSLARSIVIKHTLTLLRRIHAELSERDSTANALRLERPGERRTIFALLDLLILEGIYPSLSPGVGIPIQRRARSFVVPSQVPAAVGRVTEIDTADTELLREIVQDLSDILQPTPETAGSGYKGIEGMVRERCLVDLLAGSGELAFNPDLAEDSQKKWKNVFRSLTEGLVLFTVIRSRRKAWCSCM